MKTARNSTICLLEGLFKKLSISGAGEDSEQLERSCAPASCAKWHRAFGKKFDDFLQMVGRVMTYPSAYLHLKIIHSLLK